MPPLPANANRCPVEPLPENIRGVQPGRGYLFKVELAWGRVRRRWLRTFRQRYVRRMAEKRQGDADGAPHEILDPRDLKYCRNQCSAHWLPQDDPFRWREKIPFARWGLCELLLLSLPMLAATIALALSPWWYAAFATGVPLVLITWFFRDPPRRVPGDPGLVVAPADGTVVEIEELDYDEFCGGPAVKIGIFLSIFNVHINRAPTEARCIRLKYTPGKYLNALKAASARENEAMSVYLEEESLPHRKLWVKQISGAIARRIVCDLKPGEVLARGAKFGMIKLGSRTELMLPREGLDVTVKLGQKIKAGTTVLARYEA